MLRQQRLIFILCALFVPLAIGRPSKRTTTPTLSKKEQQRLALERARIRDAIRKEFHSNSAPSRKKTPSPQKPATKKPVRKAPPKKKVPTKKAPQKKRPAPQKPTRIPIRRPNKKKTELSAHQKLVQLRRTIDKLAHEADKHTSIGVKVHLLANHSTVYEKNAGKLFKPASNTKLITAAAAYHILGPSYRFRTTLFTDKKINSKTINNLYIRGSGDPTLTDKDLTKMVKHLKAQGITEIRGNIVVDHTLFNSQGTGPGVRKADGALYDKAPTSALMCNHSCVRVTVTPTKIVGRKPHVAVSPHTSYITVNNNARTRTKTQGRSLHIVRGENNVITIKGVISKRSKPKTYRIAVKHPSRFTGHVLKQVLKQQGISVHGKVISGKVPKFATYLTEHASKQLSGIITFMMKASDNLYADAIFRAMGAHRYGAPGTWTKGKRAVEEFLKDKVGLNPTEFTINDGSGLSHKNRIAPKHLCQLLMWEYTKSPHKESFIASLPIGGVDGTLRNRMKHHSTRTHVKAKTGSLSGVTSLSGYITPKTGLPLIFVIMVNRSNKSAVVFKRKLEDQLCKLLAAHAFSAH